MTKSLQFTTQLAGNLAGKIRVPGDKSISHRSVMFSSIAEGVSHISGLLEGEDVLATLAAFRAMGVQAEGPEDGKLTVHGVGMRGLKKSEHALDMGNSGTAMRLLCGLLAPQKFESELIGDESLSGRPMKRVTDPLKAMGANCQTQGNGCPPIKISPVDEVQGIHYDLPMASAQVKSAVLLAGLYANSQTSVTEPAPTRDHTERMLQAFGYQCETVKLDEQKSTMLLQGGGKLTAANIDVPADISSAAFFMVAASIVPDSDIVLEHVGINPTRTGIIDVLKQMGADIEFLNQRKIGGEPVADIRVRYVGLRGIEVDPKYVPLAIDEFPVLCIAAACAEGETSVSGADELRHKESDRISAMAQGLANLGIQVEEFDDGMKIFGGQFKSGKVESFHDHRIAMSFAIAGARCDGQITINGCDNVATSFPNFVELASNIGIRVQSNYG